MIGDAGEDIADERELLKKAVVTDCRKSFKTDQLSRFLSQKSQNRFFQTKQFAQPFCEFLHIHGEIPILPYRNIGNIVGSRVCVLIKMCLSFLMLPAFFKLVCFQK